MSKTNFPRCCGRWTSRLAADEQLCHMTNSNNNDRGNLIRDVTDTELLAEWAGWQ